MKSLYIFLGILCSSGFAFSQNSITLDQNNVRAHLQDNGLLFQNESTNSSGYEFPKDANTYLMYSMGLWIMGLDQNGQLKGTASMYGGDLRSGPIPNQISDYSLPEYTSNYDSCLWTVTKAEVDYHLANWITTGYTPTPNLANWPGNGVAAAGVSGDLAPYVDHNNDGNYNPLDGDYPDIRGDEAVYIIMNAENDPLAGNQTGADNMGVELHLMVYQYANTGTEVDNSTFVNAKLYNKRTISYSDLVFGVWTDFDIGSGIGDYIGTDSTRNMVYAYNGTAVDMGGFGSNPPACGVYFLNEDIQQSMHMFGTGGVQGDPQTASEYYQYLNGQFKNGQHLTYGGNGLGGTTDAYFAFSGDPTTSAGWSEVSEGNPAGDRRILMSSQNHAFPAGGDLCFDFGIVADQSSGHFLSNINSMKTASDVVKTYYDDNIAHCWYVNPTVGQLENEPTDISIYPNPSSGEVAIEVSENGVLNIYTLEGKHIQTEQLDSGVNAIDLDVNAGIYVMQMQFGNETVVEKLVVK